MPELMQSIMGAVGSVIAFLGLLWTFKKKVRKSFVEFIDAVTAKIIDRKLAEHKLAQEKIDEKQTAEMKIT